MAEYGITTVGTNEANSILASADYKTFPITIARGEGKLLKGAVLSLTADGTKYKHWGSNAVTGIAVTFTAATDLVGKTSHGYSEGMKVYFTSVTTTTGITTNAIYYIVDVDTDTFKIALTPGGVPIDLATGDGTGVMAIPADTDTNTIDAILGVDVDATSADVNAFAYVAGEFNLDKLNVADGAALAAGVYKKGSLIFRNGVE